MNAHTPGPWEYRKDYARVTSGGMSVAYVHGGDEERMDANGRLIAVAPELLDFAREWLADHTAAGSTDSPREAQARALIAKATGAA